MWLSHKSQTNCSDCEQYVGPSGPWLSIYKLCRSDYNEADIGVGVCRSCARSSCLTPVYWRRTSLPRPSTLWQISSGCRPRLRPLLWSAFSCQYYDTRTPYFQIVFYSWTGGRYHALIFEVDSRFCSQSWRLFPTFPFWEGLSCMLLLTAINRTDFVSCCMLYMWITKCIREKMPLYFRGWTIKSYSSVYEIDPINRSM